MKYFKLICFVCFFLNGRLLFSQQLFASAEKAVEQKKITEPEALAACPTGGFGSITLTPNKPMYCVGMDITCKFNPSFSISGNVTWNYTGTAAGNSLSGPSNAIDNIHGLMTTGNAVVSGNFAVGALTCPFSVSTLIKVDDLVTDAGPDLTYMPGYSPSLNIGTNICHSNGAGTYSPLWTSDPTIIAPLNACKTKVSGLTSNTTYVLTVTDSYCSVSDQMVVTLACPPDNSLVSISTSPAQAAYCAGATILGSAASINSFFSLTGTVTWGYTGAPAVTTSGTYNENYSLAGLSSGGNLLASGSVAYGSLVCPFNAQATITRDILTVDAGPDKTYAPGYTGPVTIGVSSCILNAVGVSTSPSWSPSTFLSTTSACQPVANLVTTTTTYILTASDSYCSATDAMVVTLVCPPSSNLGNITILPNQPIQCPGSNISGSFNITNSNFSFNSSVTWAYTGSNIITGSSTNNKNYSIIGLSSGGSIKATGTLKAGTLTCPIDAVLNVTLSNLAANAGADQTYIPGVSSPLTLGGSPCMVNGNPSYTEAWAPTTFFNSSSTICNPSVKDLTTTMTYDLTVNDAYCSATDVMNVTLACPDALTIAALSILPSQPVYCVGSNITGDVFSNNSFFALSGPVTWGFTGTGPLTSSGSPYNKNYSIASFQTTGVISASGSMKVIGGTMVCPFSTHLTVTKTTLAANAGGTQVYVTGGPVVAIGANPCALNYTGSYTSSWAPATFMTSATNICQPTVNNVTTTTTYTLTVTDTYCSASSTMNVILGAEPYAILRKTLDGGYFKINSNNTLYFKYDAEYNSSSTISYKIFSETSTTPVYSNTNLSLVKNYGYNRYSINLAAASITAAGYYYMEVTNEKNEVFKLKFKI